VAASTPNPTARHHHQHNQIATSKHPTVNHTNQQVTNAISFFFSLTGTSFVIRRLGLYK
jgi:hypothetical protein